MGKHSASDTQAPVNSAGFRERMNSGWNEPNLA